MSKTDIANLCKANGFILREEPLEGRLLVVLMHPTIVIKASLGKKEKKFLLKKSISHLLKCPCKRGIFWQGKQQFFHL